MVWVVLLAIWMFLWGLLAVSNFQFEASRVVMGLLAIAVAVCVAVERWRKSS